MRYQRMETANVVVRVTARTTLGWLLALFVPAHVSANELNIHVLPLKHRPASTLLDSIRPLLSPGGSVASHGGQLIIKTTPENLVEIQALLDELDTPLAQLLVTVRNNSNTSRQLNLNRIEGQINTGNVSVGTNRKGSGTITSTTTTTNRVVVRRSTNRGSQDGSYSLRVLEGHSAYIQAGEEVPVISAYGSSRRHEYVEKRYKPVTSGFYVIPQVYGDRVTLHISTQKSQRDGQEIDTEVVETTVSGRLGEWINLGGVNLTGDNQQRDISRYHSTGARNTRSIAIKVERSGD